MKTNPIGKYSLLASAIMGVLSQPLYAQEAEPDNNNAAEEDVVEVIDVRGTRRDLFNAQNLKRFSDTVVDALEASDIGGFPDRSVLESIARLPGVTMGRFAGPNDPDHFGTEGSGVNVRGLTYVRSEFNGRDSFTADAGRGLSFQDVPPELMGSVKVIKNPSADMIEGGIAGTVNLITKKPFDNDGQVFAFSADVTFSDFVEETTPTFSALYSNTYENDNGKFGVLFNVSHSELKALSDGAMVGEYFEQNSGDGFVPETARLTRKEDDRERSGFAAAFQWQSPDDKIRATAEYIRSDSKLTWNERAVEFDDDNVMRDLLPVDGTEFEFNEQGYFEKGIITSTAGWRGNEGDRTPGGIFGANHVLQTRYRDNESTVQDLSFNVQYAPNDMWVFNFDLQIVEGTNEVLDFSVMNGTDAVVGVDVTQGDKPIIDFYEPNYNGGPTDRSSTHFSDPRFTYMRSAMDHVSDNEGDEVATRFDAKYTFDDGLITSAQVGVRYAKREQTTRQSTYNWGNISEAWNGPAWLDTVDSSLYEAVELNDFSRGGVLTVDGGPTFLFPSLSLVENYRGAFDALTPVIRDGGWSPLANRSNANGDFTQNEINETTETNTAAYIRLDYEGYWGDLDYSGNFGVRYVNIENEVLGGGVIFPDSSEVGSDVFPFLPADQQAFINGGSVNRDSSNDFNKVLPTFNFKMNLSEEVVFRFGYSESLTLPDLGLLRDFVDIRTDQTTRIVGDDTDGDGQPDLIGAFVGQFLADTGNPALKPIESNNIDITLEYYFAPVGSLTLALFHKDVTNFFVNGSRVETIANNGATQDVIINTPTNSGDGTIQGYEIAYQQFYDKLPAPFDGIGIQANYTYIDEDGSPNPNLAADNPDGGVSADASNLEFQESLPLERLSQHNFNFVLMYEKYGWNARAAYNWRSEYLLTTADVITGLPIFNENNGFLDASVFYDITENLKIGIQGTNLTDEVTQTSMQVDAQGTQRLRASFINDRRFSFVVRGVF